VEEENILPKLQGIMNMNEKDLQEKGEFLFCKKEVN